MPADAERFRDEDVLVVGGGTRPGRPRPEPRAPRAQRVAVRGDGLSSTMSRYLIDRSERTPRVEVMTRTEVTELHGRGSLDAVTLRTEGGEERVPVRAVFVMIGAEPCTEAVAGVVVDAAGYLCGLGAAPCDGRPAWPLADRAPHLLETVRPGVLRRRRRARRGDQPGRRRGGRRGAGHPLRVLGPGRLTPPRALGGGGLTPAGGAQAADDDLGLVGRKPRAPGRREQGGVIDGAVDVGDGAAAPADQVVVLVGARVVDGGAALRGDPAHEADLLEQLQVA